jgi:hypothetical protein
MGDAREPDTQPDPTRSTREASEADLARVAKEWRRQTRQAGERRNPETEGWLKAFEAKHENPRNTLLEVLVHGCCSWSLVRLASAVLLIVLVAALGRRGRG